MYCQYTDRVEPFGMDECWLDLTDIYGIDDISTTADDISTTADEIRKRVRDELGLTCSVGVSFNKSFAKLGSDYKKPDAATLITKENFRDLVWPLPVGDLLYVGYSTQKRLARININTIGQLAQLPFDYLRSYLGKNGEGLYVEIARIAMELFRRSYTWEKSVRSIGVRVMQVSSADACRQISIFDPDYQTDEKAAVAKVIDNLLTGSRRVIRYLPGSACHDEITFPERGKA